MTGADFRRIREQCGWTQHQFARLLGTTMYSVHRWEGSASIQPQLALLLAMLEGSIEARWLLLEIAENAGRALPKSRKRRGGRCEHPENAITGERESDHLCVRKWPKCEPDHTT